jgi:hypothetical protein
VIYIYIYYLTDIEYKIDFNYGFTGIGITCGRSIR